ncbi:hypothetical protein [Dongia sedimenti]|uniref:Preprotein translocase subunit SecE n=1 Tax=Dongia sedimenti TaxID=3064282 RepID=A0ABU0YN85_9PROT|nr:hypothetical protein [Rhodospirillaceae bacterium R-7]
MNEDLSDVIKRLKRRYWNLREIVGLTLAIIFAVLLFAFGLDWMMRLVIAAP